MFDKAKLYIKNLPGKKTKRKIVVIYADDFGSIRIKDKKAKDTLSEAGLPMDKTRYSFDTLLSNEDFEMLYEVLASVKDCNGNYACITPFANIANPDFDRIRESGFSQYYRESFVQTLERYGNTHNQVYDFWKQGIAENVFRPEYHGTEHVNVHRFMRALQEGHRSVRNAFDNESVCVPTFPGEKPVWRASGIFTIEKAMENEALKDDIRTGMKLFEELLGYRPKQFTPGGGPHSPILHPTLYKEGIKYIHTKRNVSFLLGDGKYTKKERVYNGKHNEVGQIYIIRNCPFEPTWDNCQLNQHVVKTCLDNVAAAFFMHSPAYISTHRVNFSGSIDARHRDYGMQQLRLLLSEIVRRWPDVEFMSGDKMSKTLFNDSL